MKKFILNILFLCMCYTAQLQEAPRDTVYLSNTDFKKMFDEKYYTILSNKNFEEYTGTKIKNEIDSRWSGFLGWLLGGGVLIITFIYAYLRKEQNSKLAEEKTAMKKESDEKIDSEFKKLEGRLTEKISHVYLTTVRGQYEDQLKILEKSYLDKIKELDQKFQEIERKTQTSTVNMIRTELNSLKEAKANTQEDYNQLKQFLAEAEELNDSRLLTEIINELARIGYTLAKTTDIVKVIDKYMDKDDINITANSYVNAASSLFYDYASSKDSELGRIATKYLNKSLQKIESYGEALALKLEFLMLDLELEFEPEEQEKIRYKAARVFEQILESPYAGKEAQARFERVITNPVEGKYVEMLKKEFKNEMTQLEAGGADEKAEGA